MYKQNLYSIHTSHLKDKKIKNQNRYKKFKSGYNEGLDCVIISKDGTIGDIYEIQGLKIAIHKIPEKEYYSIYHNKRCKKEVAPYKQFGVVRWFE